MSQPGVGGTRAHGPLEFEAQGVTRQRVERRACADGGQCREPSRQPAITIALGERGQWTGSPDVEQGGVVVEHESPRGVRVQLVGESARQFHDAGRQYPLEVMLTVERVERERVASESRHERAVARRAALMDVHERQPFALRPEPPQQISPLPELVEAAAAHARVLHVVERADR